MGHAGTDVRAGRAAIARGLLLSALALAGALLFWRGVEAFAASPAGALAGSTQEVRLARLLEPVAGAGKVQISVRETPDGVSHYLVMLDRAPENGAELVGRVEAVIAAAAGYNPAIGDTLSVQQFPFASGVASRPNLAAMTELGAISVLCGLILGAFFLGRSRRAEPVSFEASLAPTDARISTVRPIAGELIEEEAGPALSQAGQAAAMDPAGAAQVLRRWMRVSGGAA